MWVGEVSSCIDLVRPAHCCASTVVLDGACHSRLLKSGGAWAQAPQQGASLQVSMTSPKPISLEPVEQVHHDVDVTLRQRVLHHLACSRRGVHASLGWKSTLRPSRRCVRHVRGMFAAGCSTHAIEPRHLLASQSRNMCSRSCCPHGITPRLCSPAGSCTATHLWSRRACLGSAGCARLRRRCVPLQMRGGRSASAGEGGLWKQAGQGRGWALQAAFTAAQDPP